MKPIGFWVNICQAGRWHQEPGSNGTEVLGLPYPFLTPTYSDKWHFCEYSGSQDQGPPNTAVKPSESNQWI